MITKVVIAAAGQGTRMLHLTKNKCKHLIKIQNKPFLAYVLDNLLDAGYKEIILVVGYADDLMKKFLKEYKYKVTVINQFEVLGPKEEIYGTACPLMCVKDIIKNEQFLFICGDNLYSVKDLKAMNIDDEYNYVAGLHHENPEKYGVLVTDNGFLDKIVEKPSPAKISEINLGGQEEYISSLINAGMYKFTPEVFKFLPKIKKSLRGEYEITDVITLLAKKKNVKIKKIEDYWKDFGNPGDIIKLSKFIKKIKTIKIVPANIKEIVFMVVKELAQGRVLVCPTDTVYGLVCDAANKKAVEKIFKIKKRAKTKPLPIFIKDIKAAKKIAFINKKQEKILKEKWPGKFTFVLKKRKTKIFGVDKKTIALRIPNHQLVRLILEKYKKPLAQTSANISGQQATTKINEVLKQFKNQPIKPNLVLDAGNLKKSKPSKVLDLTDERIKILRY